jgi:hypothetical protein
MWAFCCGRPLESRCHVEPASLVRQTAAAPSGIVRPWPGSSGIT